NLPPPDELAVEVERRQHRRAEQDVHALPVGGRRRRAVAAAQVAQQPRARLDLHVPELLAVGDGVAADAVLRILLLDRLAARPVDGRYEHAVPPDDRAGLTLPFQRHLPEDVLAGLAVPAARQILFVAQRQPARTAEARPVARGGRWNQEQTQRQDKQWQCSHTFPSFETWCGRRFLTRGGPGNRRGWPSRRWPR